MVADSATAILEFRPKVPHGREEKHETLFVSPDVRRFLVNFRHPYDVYVGVEIIERTGVEVELITQHDYQISHG